MANKLFGIKEYGEWKAYCSTEPQDNNTLPSFNNVRRAEHYSEAMALNIVVEEIMEDGINDAMWNVTMKYHQSSRIMCSISTDLLNRANDIVACKPQDNH